MGRFQDLDGLPCLLRYEPAARPCSVWLDGIGAISAKVEMPIRTIFAPDLERDAPAPGEPKVGLWVVMVQKNQPVEAAVSLATGLSVGGSVRVWTRFWAAEARHLDGRRHRLAYDLANPFHARRALEVVDKFCAFRREEVAAKERASKDEAAAHYRDSLVAKIDRVKADTAEVAPRLFQEYRDAFGSVTGRAAAKEAERRAAVIPAHQIDAMVRRRIYGDQGATRELAQLRAEIVAPLPEV